MLITVNNKVKKQHFYDHWKTLEMYINYNQNKLKAICQIIL